jgi:hypothetical protein
MSRDIVQFIIAVFVAIGLFWAIVGGAKASGSGSREMCRRIAGNSAKVIDGDCYKKNSNGWELVALRPGGE